MQETQQINQKAKLLEALDREDLAYLSWFFFKFAPTPTQLEIIKDIVYERSRRINISAMTRYGKTKLVAVAIGLKIILSKNKKIKFIGPTRELAQRLMEYLGELFMISPDFYQLADFEDVQKERQSIATVSRKKVTFKNGCSYEVISAFGEGFAAMGTGGDIIVIDELGLLSKNQYAKIFRLLGDNAEKAMLIELYNPWSRDTMAYEHSVEESYKRYHISWQTAVKEGRTTEVFVEEARQNMPERDFKVLYESEFPDDETGDYFLPESLIKYAYVEPKEIGRERPHPDFEYDLGLDPARYGTDETAFCISEHNPRYTEHKTIKIVNMLAYQGKDTTYTEGITIAMQREWRFKNIFPDEDGLGAGVVDHLRAEHLPIIAVTAGARAYPKNYPVNDSNNEAMFKNLRYLFERQKERFLLNEARKAKGEEPLPDIFLIPKLPKLIKQLRDLKQDYSAGGRLRVEGDPEINAHDDYADALALSLMRFIKKKVIHPRAMA